MYEAILTAAGYTKWTFTIPFYGTDCWVKEGRPDINVDTRSGLWADEHDGVGRDEASLSAYLIANR